MGLSLSLLLSAWNEVLRYNWFGSATTIENVLARSLSFDRDTGGLTSETAKKIDRNLQAYQAPNKMAAKSTLKPLGTAQMNIPALNLPDPFVMFSPRPASELDAAATKVQKVYKSYRTRRNLADCAVLVEELWWKALDSAALKQCSVSFFNVQKPESALSRWARARTRAAKVGKGLSKNEKAQKLALQHWLEAIDPRHRYGHNLHFYYDVWSETKSSQPFFYWLDIGDGKEVNLKKCPKVDLQRQCIKYLGPKEREEFEVIVECGKLVHKQTGMLVETSEGCKWIFVLSTTRSLYVGKKKKGVFQHSSFLSGGAISSAGRLVAHEGVLEAIWPYSGHYLPTEDNFKEFISFLEEHNVDLANVKRCAVDDDDPSLTSSSSSIELREETDEEQSTMETSAHTRASIISTSVTGTGTGTGTTRLQQAHAGVPDVKPAPLLTLAKRLSSKWTSGVSPRIGCIRDYPTELQSQALEHVNLSPRHTPSRLAARCPIPSPRPSPKIRVSPRLAYMGLTSPRVHG